MNTLVNSHLNIIYSDEVQLESMDFWTHGYVGYLFPQPIHSWQEGRYFLLSHLLLRDATVWHRLTTKGQEPT